jgi:polysaccharide pyruvyl transferase WcaK-like protein
VIAEETDYLKKWYPEVHFLPNDKIKKINTHFLLYGGGTQFFSFGGEHWRKWKNRLKNIPRYACNPHKSLTKILKNTKSNKIRASKVCSISIGIGPFVTGSEEEKEAERSLKSCDWISVRDPVSFHWLENRNINGAFIHPDLGYAKELWLDRPIRIKKKSERIKKIGIVIRWWPHSKEGMSYFVPLCQAVKKLRSLGLHVQFISFAYKYDAKVMYLLNKMGEKVLAWNPYKEMVASFAEKLMSFDLIITARAHGFVIASIHGIPSITIDLEPKLNIFRNSININSVGWSSPFKSEDLLKYIKDIIRSDSSVNQLLINHCEKLSSKASISISELINWMDGFEYDNRTK